MKQAVGDLAALAVEGLQADSAERWQQHPEVESLLALISVGIAIGYADGVIIAAVGVLPLAAGVFNFCVAGPLSESTSWAAGPQGADPRLAGDAKGSYRTQATVRS